MQNLGRSLSLAVVSSAVLIGCSAQPVGPSRPVASMAATSVNGGAPALNSVAGGRPASPGIVYVREQGLYYDTFATVDPLPMRGRFQAIGDTDGDGIADTQYGPGNPGYLGGRWWEDTNRNGVQDAGDHFFQCPLLGPGREIP